MVYEKDITVAESAVSLDILDTASNVSNITSFCVLTKKAHLPLNARKFDIKQMLATSSERMNKG